jgi:hypothetical protein
MNGRYRDGLALQNVHWAAEVKDQRDKEKAVAVRARQRVLGRELRRMFDEVVQEPVPDDFLSLLKQIDEGKDNKKDANA